MTSKLTRGEYKALCRRADEMHKDDPDFKKASNREFVVFLVLVIALALAIRLFIFEPVRVSGDSMYPTLLNGERMFVQKVGYWFHEPARGDVIICYYPGATQTCVKRVIGLPGDVVQVLEGKIYVNGEPLEESVYWNDEIWGDTFPVEVPENNVFVVGDNRNYSLDSRDVGPIPYEKIVGETRHVIWPIRSARTILGT